MVLGFLQGSAHAAPEPEHDLRNQILSCLKELAPGLTEDYVEEPGESEPTAAEASTSLGTASEGIAVRSKPKDTSDPLRSHVDALHAMVEKATGQSVPTLRLSDVSFR